jgi:hypothetical protein
MTAVVFIGPTISQEQAREACAAECLAPVRQGDIYRAVRRHRPRAIGIVDGIFQHVPSVWHKEILWAMAQGVHVFGAASMGALRAAELQPFGMRGVGRIFEAYRTGVLELDRGEAFEDDDEVAVIHGPMETGYVPLSEAMVNIRCTLAKAEAAGIIGGAMRDALTGIAKGMFYQERSYERLLDHTEVEELDSREISRLRDWLPGGQVNQKRDDAQAMLAAMRGLLDEDPTPVRVDYDFAHTTLWENAIASATSELPAEPAAESETVVLDELRLDHTAYLAARQAAQRRLVSLQECDRQSIVLGRDEPDRTIARLRRTEGLPTRSDLERWLADNDLDHAGFVRLMRDEARLQKLETEASGILDCYILDHLRSSGAYSTFAAHAREKQQALVGPGTTDPPGDGPVELRALVWYFESRLGIEFPADLDAYARGIGFEGKGPLLRAVWREFLFQGKTKGGCHGKPN